MIKSDASVMVHADTGGYQPQNWMCRSRASGRRDAALIHAAQAEREILAEADDR